jgi:di- and tripeptidase
MNVISSAHYGYVYCMAIWPSNSVGTDDVHSQPLQADMQNVAQLVTGSGDENVKVCVI